MRPLLIALMFASASAWARADLPAVADFNTCALPEWPKAALRAGQEGPVTLRFMVESDGHVSDAQIKVTSGFPLLDEAARAGLMKCRFQPATKDGKAVSGWMQMQYLWTLEDREETPTAVREYAFMQEEARDGEARAQLYLGGMLENGRGVKRDLAQAVDHYTRAAAQGLPEAQYRLGRIAFKAGKLEEAAAWYRKAAEQQHRYAGTALLSMLRAGSAKPVDGGELERRADAEARQQEMDKQLREAADYFDGRGKPKDAAKSLQLLEPLAQQGYAVAQGRLGAHYEHGDGTPVDHAMALKWYRLAAAAGDANGRNGLAWMLLRGMGTEKDPARAAVLFRQSALEGNVKAMVNYARTLEAGPLASRNYARSNMWLRMAANAGDPSSQVELGYRLTKKGDDASYAEANGLYRRAALRGQGMAENNLGYSYEMGWGMPADATVAMDWYLRAASRGNANAEASIGSFYERGLVVPANMDMALGWYRLSAGHKGHEGLRRLAILHEEGRGVARDEAQALSYFEQAAAVGDEPAMRRLVEVYSFGQLGQKPDLEKARKYTDALANRSARMAAITAGL